jgi:hypothetical protein
MTNAEFQKKLIEMYESSYVTNGKTRKTFNELVWVLRQSNADYNISISPYTEDMGWICIPSIKECFIPVTVLSKYVKKVEIEDDDFEYDGICLTVVLEDDEDDWFGIVRWCEDDLKAALEDQGYPVTENNIAKLYGLCSHHRFTDHMIEAGWEYMYSSIGYGDEWDKPEMEV